MNVIADFFFATSQTVYLFLPRLTDGTARIIIFHRERENHYEKFLPPYAAAGIRTHVSQNLHHYTWDHSGLLCRLSYRDRGKKVTLVKGGPFRPLF